MKLLILHLSDMHFQSHDNFREENIKAIVGTLQQSAAGIQHIIIIVSGDCAFSGKKDESIQVAKFFESLKNAISKRYKIQDIQFAIVPGNHDVDYDLGMMDRSGLEAIEKTKSYESSIKSELQKQQQFYTLAKRFKCYQDCELVHQKTIAYGRVKILLNLINTAIFSAKTDEDQGFHYLPETCIRALSNQGDSDFVITVMHHPHHVFNSCCKKELEKAIYSCSDLIYVGHEHYESAQKIESRGASVHIYAGGELCNKGDWSNSEFHVTVLDLETREYHIRNYKINAGVYEECERSTIELSQNRYNKLGLVVRSDFVKELDADKYAIAISNQDYFVFPLLVEEYLTDERSRLPKEIDSLNDFVRMLSEKGKIIINGRSDTGKSILARAIFKSLSKSKVTLFVNGIDVSRNYERTIQAAFEDAYSKEKILYEEFKQMSPSDMAIVIDDVDYIEETRQSDFIKYVEERFGTVVETCQFDIDMDVDIKDRLKKRAETSNFTFYRIEPFYADKRKQLVENIVRIILHDELETQERYVAILCDALTKQKYLYSLNPEFIVQFVQYYCKNIGEAMQNDGSVFSKVFEANLTNLINPFAKKITVEKIFIILDKMAYFIHVNSKNAYPISLTQMDTVIQEYNCVYGAKINTLDFLEILLQAKILKKCEGKYLFFDRNYLAYFAAREIRRESAENGIYTQFDRAMKCSYNTMNANILLFVTYITDNLNIIRMIMQEAETAVRKWSEFDLRNIDIPFLVKSADEVVKPVTQEDQKIEEEKKIKQERQDVQTFISANDASVFDGVDNEPNLLNELVRSISLMAIISRTLPSFEHMMKKPEKEQCVRLIYQMPQKIFEAWAKEVDTLTSELVRDIKDYHEWEFRRERSNYEPLDDQKALELLRNEATLMLLELMNTAIMNATRYNANEILDSFPYQDKPTYSIEHLIGLRHRDNVALFKEEVERLIQEKTPMTRNLARWVTRNYIVNSRNMKPHERQSLNAKVLNEGVAHSRLIVEHSRNKKKY